MPASLRPDDLAVWNPLRQAIAESSGFQEWLQAQGFSYHPAAVDNATKHSKILNVLIHHYLEETLSTLAY